MNTGADINSAWESIRENIKIPAREGLGYYEVRKHMPWVDEGCSKLFDQRKDKLQWLHNPRKITVYNITT
jgi:hypothetical protein